MERQLRQGGGIMDVVPREAALFGGLKKAIKKVTKTVKNVAKSPVGKAAIFAGIAGIPFGGGKFFGEGSLFGKAGPAFSNLFKAKQATEKISGAQKALNALKVGAAVGGLSGLAAAVEQGDEEAIEATRNVDALKTYLRQGYRNLKSFVKADGSEDTEALEAQVNRDVSEYSAGAGGYAQGGRIGFAEGTYDDFEEFMKERGKAMKNFNRDRILEEFRQYMKRQDPTVEAAEGGRIEYAMGDSASDNAMQAAGIEGLPVRQNPKGVKELDLRETGGFIPPVGIKEKEDDIPAMLSNNEFVFTADAVRGMGDGDVNKGAERMYNMMKTLEAGGRV